MTSIDQNIVDASNKATESITNIIGYVGILVCGAIASILFLVGIILFIKVMLHKNDVIDMTSSFLKIAILFGAGTIFSTIATTLFGFVNTSSNNALFIIGNQAQTTITDYIRFVVGIICSIGATLMIIYALVNGALLFFNRKNHYDLSKQTIKLVSFLIIGALLGFIGSTNVFS